MAGSAKNSLTLPERKYAKQKPRVSKETMLPRWVLLSFVVISLLHLWQGLTLSFPAACVLAIMGWLLGDWGGAGAKKRGTSRKWQRLSFGQTITRMADGSAQVSVRRSQVDFVRADKKDNGRKDFKAVLKDGTERLLLEDVLPDEVVTTRHRIEQGLAPKAPEREPLRVRVESTGAGYRSVEQAMTIEVSARPFVGKAPSVFSRKQPKPRAFQRVRVGEQIVVETDTQKRELGHTKNVSLRVKYDIDTVDVWVRCPDGTESLLLDRLDFQEFASLRKALPASLVIEK